MHLEPVDVLVAEANRGNQQAWNAIVDRYSALVWAIARSFHLNDADAADVSQTVWLRAVEHLPALREPAALPGWLSTTTRRECIRAVTTGRGVPGVSLDQMVNDPPADEELTAPDAELLAIERREVLRAALRELPELCQRLLSLLTAAEPVSYATISERLEMPLGSIGPTRARCLRRLRANPSLRRWTKDIDHHHTLGGGT